MSIKFQQVNKDEIPPETTPHFDAQGNLDPYRPRESAPIIKELEKKRYIVVDPDSGEQVAEMNIPIHFCEFPLECAGGQNPPHDIPGNPYSFRSIENGRFWIHVHCQQPTLVWLRGHYAQLLDNMKPGAFPFPLRTANSELRKAGEK